MFIKVKCYSQCNVMKLNCDMYTSALSIIKLQEAVLIITFFMHLFFSCLIVLVIFKLC